MKILAVDDEPGILRILKCICNQHDITTETSPVKAAERIRKETYDVFIVDYQMPQINGLELLKDIQDVYEDKDYVSIFCTSIGSVYLYKEELLRGLFDFFIEKPFGIDTFLELLDHAGKKLEYKKNETI
jgi:DNA-binding NtrC family response regulator